MVQNFLLTEMTRSLMINEVMNQIDTTLATLADPARRRVVELLRSEPLRASAIADRTSMSRAAISRHLRIMERSGLVVVETPDDDARGRLYRLRPEALAALGAWLDQVQAFWSEQMGAVHEPARHRLRPDHPHRGGRAGGGPR